ncbi:MAG TPA: carboxypeptidase regulatory-like domain-containing protein [Chitinophagales bacterium]|nr:carboxypeptidase regulatory-like domain-containing protein [Chitinophagales bacterium]
MPKIPAALLFTAIYVTAFSQGNAVVFGRLTDQSGDVIAGANISLLNNNSIGTISDSSGKYQLTVPSGKNLQFVFSFIGFKADTIEMALKPNQRKELNVTLYAGISLPPVEISENEAVRNEAGGAVIEIKSAEYIPTPFSDFTAILAQAGASGTNELSSSYSVRGGNFDENLVYVNDFEVYRPFLIRSGQQEGLSFINTHLVSSAYFSTGGFQSKYGDKMSSVLDVQYKKPQDFKGSLELGLLGGSLHVEGADKKNKFTYLLGVRQKSSQYLLKSLDTRGEYSPAFTDIQSYITYKLNSRTDFDWITNFAMNRFHFKPVDRETTFGVVNNVLRLTMYFDGGEKDAYRTFMTGFGVNQRLNKHLGFKWLASVYRSVESEAFDIIGEYWLDEVESDFSSQNFGQTRYSLGVGTQHEYVRNDLEALVAAGGYKGYYLNDAHKVRWGLNYQHEIIEDRINEWERLDSAGYSLPYNTEQVLISSVLKSKINLSSNRISAYLQDTWSFGSDDRLSFTCGVRLTWWDVNKEWVASPRIQFSYRPITERDIVFRAATGIYAQPPFYREMRDLNGNVNTNLKAQKSLHAVMGFDWNFKAWERKFKFVTEVYYKYLWNLVPYEFDNVLIRYFGENVAEGYAAGVDFRLHGELVEDAESWVSLSLLSTQEDIEDDYFNVYYDADGNRIYLGSGDEESITDTVTVHPGFISRPTDQRVRFNLFFQDYLPKLKTFKVHLNLVFASGLPFGPPDQQRYNDVLRIPFYRRVDIGFSARLFDKTKKELPPKNFFRHFESIWATLEIYNLLGVNNTVSYLWVKDINNTVYAVPNYLTNRRINFRIIFKV